MICIAHCNDIFGQAAFVKVEDLDPFNKSKLS